MLRWKEERQGETALLIEGARRIGKSTIVEEFAKNEYSSYILVDFSKTATEINDLFNDLSDLNYIFLRLQLNYNVSLKERKSLIIFDEVQNNPKARQAIKHLVKDHRYDYIETGSLISIRKNVQNINFFAKNAVSIWFPDQNTYFKFGRSVQSRCRLAGFTKNLLSLFVSIFLLN